MDDYEHVPVDGHLQMFETERFRLLSEEEAVAACGGAVMGLAVSGLSEFYSFVAYGFSQEPSLADHAIQGLELTSAAAFAAAAIVSTVRFLRYRRKVTFKSTLSASDLEDLYKLESSPVDH